MKQSCNNPKGTEKSAWLGIFSKFELRQNQPSAADPNVTILCWGAWSTVVISYFRAWTECFSFTAKKPQPPFFPKFESSGRTSIKRAPLIDRAHSWSFLENKFKNYSIFSAVLYGCSAAIFPGIWHIRASSRNKMILCLVNILSQVASLLSVPLLG